MPATVPATSIRPAKATESPSIEALWESSGLSAAAPDEFDALMGGDTTAMVVAERDGEIVGAAIASFDGWRAYIYHVAVEKSLRNQGIAGELMREAEQYLLSAGARYVFVMVHEENTDGLALVGSEGYLPEGEMVMAKRLATRVN